MMILIFTIIGCAEKNELIKSNLNGEEIESNISINNNNEVDEKKSKIEIITNKYSYNDENIYILYPSISGLDREKDENSINELIKYEAMSYIYPLEDIGEGLFYSLDFEVKYQSDSLISIAYYGSTFSEGASYPIDVFFTTNIDLTSGKKLSLSDLVLIDDSFVELYLSKICEESEDELSMYAYQYIQQSYSQDELESGFKQADSTYGKSRYIFSYFTGDSIGISWEVPHAVGDHVETEISFDKLTDKLNDIIKREVSLEQ